MGVRLRASFAEVFLACPISATLIRKYSFIDAGNKFTERGIRLHALGASLLREKFDIPQLGLELEKSSITETADVKEYVRFVGQLVYDVFEGLDGVQIDVEHEIDLSSVLIEGVGYIDFVAYDRNAVLVVDYKSGFVRVFPQDNAQIYIYALGLIYKHEKVDGITPQDIYVAIAQPSQRNIQMHHIKRDDLIAWHDAHKQAIQFAHDGDTTYVAGPHCEKCPFQGSCANNLLYLLKGDN